MRRVVLVGALVTAVGFTLHAQPRQAAKPAASPTYAKDVAPILHAKCITCHRPGEVAPMSLRTFDEVRPWARAIKQKVTAREMPPWFADAAHGSFSQRRALSPASRSTPSCRWVGCRRRARQPGGRTKAAGVDRWMAARRARLHHHAAAGEHSRPRGSDYFPTPNLTLDLPEDRWIRAIEIRPSNREVTHHSVIFATPVGGAGGGWRVRLLRRARRVGGRHPADGVSGRHGTLAAQRPAAADQPALSPERQTGDRSDADRTVLGQGRAEEGGRHGAGGRPRRSRFRRARRTTRCARSTWSIRTSPSCRTSPTCTCAAKT